METLNNKDNVGLQSLYTPCGFRRPRSREETAEGVFDPIYPYYYNGRNPTAVSALQIHVIRLNIFLCRTVFKDYWIYKKRKENKVFL